jgi:hypothetical protein
MVLGLTSGTNTGDWLACAGCIALFSLFMLAERIVPLETMCFVLVAFVWGLIVQPAVLNRCHLTLWLLIFAAFRNLFTVGSHATNAWKFATMADLLGLIAQ